MIYQVEIPNYIPTSINKLLQRGFRSRSKVKARDYAAIITACTLARVPKVALPDGEKKDRLKAGIKGPLHGDPVPQRRRLEIRIVWPKGSRSLDKDNTLKVIQDGLVNGGFLVDDKEKWLDIPFLPEYGYSKLSEGKTHLTITDLGPPLDRRMAPSRRIWFPDE